MVMVVEQQSLNELSAQQLREMATRLITELRHSKALNEKLTYENALLKRMKFAAQSERFNAEQRNLLEDEIDADLAAVADEIDALEKPANPPQDRTQAKRQPLPANLPRREIRHERREDWREDRRDDRQHPNGRSGRVESAA